MVFSKFEEFLASKKARVIDKLVYATMSGEKKAAIKWYKWMWAQRVNDNSKKSAGKSIYHGLKKE